MHYKQMTAIAAWHRFLVFACILLCVVVGMGDAAAADRAARAAARVKPSLVAALESAQLAWGAPLYIRVCKEEKDMEIWVQERGKKTYRLFRTYKIAYHSGSLGPKEKVGDGQVPEGFYHTDRASLNPASSYHLSFNINYPNALDRSLRRTGNLIMVHGNVVSIGCLAMTDAKIEEIYTLVEAALAHGQRRIPIHIFPFHMTPARLAAAEGGAWVPFWRDLLPAWQAFAGTRLPPATGHRAGRYTVTSPP